jgi:hypothetical protein
LLLGTCSENCYRTNKKSLEFGEVVFASRSHLIFFLFFVDLIREINNSHSIVERMIN